MRKIAFVACLLASMLALVASAAEPTTYQLVNLRTGPKSGVLPEAEAKAAFAGHFSNMERLSREGKLLVAGPYGKERHAPDLRGLFILATAKVEEAKAWAETDPAYQAGVFVLEVQPLKTEFDLAAALARHFALEDKAKAENRALKIEETMRGYVWLIADDRTRARQALAPLAAKGEVFLIGDLGASQLLALLDASDNADAKARYGPALEQAGAHTLDEWFGSSQLAHRP
jgi:uncharacterized protein YciI